MAEVPLPELQRHRALRAIVVDKADVADAALYSVTSCAGAGRPPRRRWFTDRAIALAHAAERADEHGFALIDLSSEAE
ncbi:hypothetical protein GCM10011494_02730 [Novosphingobium endophyticum]|uniref:Uncharacterized protein n=1 Tax=Novosphingobium endophyticum TaxID=1955250 RepID=A0A916TP09_9SPHN|nr:hypothetical protein [Novosphingobium endophyticum]GGB87846.1 hypothetical protein GCM10011494_02730 [Novosphingobium endophyticum]